MYNIQLISKYNNTSTFWYGGMAAEITTYPPNSTFANKDFLWRLGFAQIDIEESTFSSLPNVYRHLMVTDGKMTLSHSDKYSKTLSPFEVDSFMGDWETKTKGICSVFNLMTQKNYKGNLSSVLINHKCSYDFNYNVSYNEQIVSLCLYVFTGSFKIEINKKSYEVNSKDLLRLDCINNDSKANLKLYCSSNDPCRIIIGVIYK